MLLISTLLSMLGFRTSGVSDEQLMSHIAAGVRYYSILNPNNVIDELDLVSGVSEYELPDGVIGVRSISWWPLASEGRSASGYYRYGSAVFPEHDFAFENWPVGPAPYGCRWRLRGSNLAVSPEPSSDETVDIVYAYSHEYDASTSSYPTIPEPDDWLVVNCALADYMQNQMSLQVILPDFTEGMTSIRRGNISRSVPPVIADLYKPLWERYGV